MTDIVTPEFARAVLAARAERLGEIIAIVARNERDPIVQHRLAEVAAECEWCKKAFDTNKGGQPKWLTTSTPKGKTQTRKETKEKWKQ